MKKTDIVGKTVDGKVVISGKTVFKLLDTFGFPLDLVHDILKEKNIVFDMYEFIQCALKSGNFSIDKLSRTLSVLPYYDEQQFRYCVILIVKDLWKSFVEKKCD